MTKTSVNETEEARVWERAARFIFAEAHTEWYAEQIAHSISGDASELEVTWSFDPVEAIWCGVLDPSIPAPDVMDWSEDWSYPESSPCAEEVFHEQSKVPALTSYDASSPECVQQTEVLVAEAYRTLVRLGQRWCHQNKIAVVSSLLPMCLPVVRQIERSIVSHLWPKRSFLETVS